eukprot:scaffold310061_cov32-Tisochrysis_lutea.AAC.1
MVTVAVRSYHLFQRARARPHEWQHCKDEKGEQRLAGAAAGAARRRHFNQCHRSGTGAAVALLRLAVALSGALALYTQLREVAGQGWHRCGVGR